MTAARTPMVGTPAPNMQHQSDMQRAGYGTMQPPLTPFGGGYGPYQVCTSPQLTTNLEEIKLGWITKSGKQEFGQIEIEQHAISKQPLLGVFVEACNRDSSRMSTKCFEYSHNKEFLKAEERVKRSSERERVIWKVIIISWCFYHDIFPHLSLKNLNCDVVWRCTSSFHASCDTILSLFLYADHFLATNH